MFGKKNQSEKIVEPKPDASVKGGAGKSGVTVAADGKLPFFALLQMAVVLLVLVLVGGVLHWFLIIDGQASAQRIRAETQADVLQAQVIQQTDFLQKIVAGYARLARVVEVLDDPQLRRQMEMVLEGSLPGVSRAFLFPLGNISTDAASGFDLGFASLDLARRAERQEKVAPDAFKRGEHWLIQLAVPVVDPDSKDVRGSLLVVFDPEVLAGALSVQDPQLGGGVELQQKIGNVTQVVLHGGTVVGDDALLRPLPGTSWQLAYAPAGQVGFLMDPLQLWSLLMCAGLVAAAGIWLIFSRLQYLLRRDVTRLNQWSQKAFAGERLRVPSLQLAMMAALAESLQRLANSNDKRVVRAETQVREAREVSDVGGTGSQPDPFDLQDESSPQVAAPSLAKALLEDEPQPSLSEPLFDGKDGLDIDMLDEDEDVLGLGSPGESLFGGEMGMEVELVPVSTVDVSVGIFRAYDIRGVVGETLTPDVVRLIGQSIGSEAIGRKAATVCVGRDGRLSSAELSRALIEGLVAAGCEVIDVGQVPTPVTYFAAHHLETLSAVMVTGSHNPPDYNGLKIMLAGETLAGQAIQRLLMRIQTHNLVQGRGSVRREDVRRNYLDVILNDIAVAAPLKVVVDAGSGVAGELGPQLLEELGCEVIPLYCDIDGRFPHHHPDPGQPENLVDLIERVRSEKADLGIAFDGDGDRIGVVTNTGKIIWPDRLLMLYARDVVSRNPGADIIYDVKCTRRLAGVITAFGGRPVMAKTGHSWMKAKMRETGALLAGEMSGHIFFKERWFGFDDGLYAAARLLEILGSEDRVSDEVFADFPEDVSTPEINVRVGDEVKFDLADRLASQGRFGDGSVSTIDGVRVDFGDGWGLCRASNTTPTLVFRFEGDSEAAMLRIQGVFRDELLRLSPALNLPF